MKYLITRRLLMRKARITLIAGVLLFIQSTTRAQLGVYSFTGTGNCPHQNPAVNSQPANASFSNFSTTVSCDAADDIFQTKGWTPSASINLSEYNQFTVTPASGYGLTLTSLAFTQNTNEDPNTGSTSWTLRSSLDNYTTDIATGVATVAAQTPSVTLPAAFTNTGAVTFRLYLANVKSGGTRWAVDEVTLTGTTVTLPADPANPGSNSPQCASPGVTMSFTGSAPAGETWYWQTTAEGTSTANSSSSYTVTSSGTYYVRSQDNTTLAWSAGAGSVTVTISPNVGTPVFTLGATSTRCQGTGTVTYTASASNSSGITYSLDAASIAGGNSINATTGAVTYANGWTGNTIITASAAGCNGPLTATHTVLITPIVSAPTFTLGAASTRCQGAGTVSYTASASNSSGITYSLDAASIAGGNIIVAATGAVTYAAGWSGITTITATAAGCNGPAVSTHTVTVSATIGTPVFTSGATSTRCQGAGTVTYTATSANGGTITYSLDNASITAGNSINSSTGAVTYTAGWTGASVITATAAGCGGPKTATHTVTNTSTIGVPVFTLGATSTRCQGAGTVTYSATSAGSTGMSYALDAASIAGGNSINTSTGAVTYVAGWAGNSMITATAIGCNGPTTAIHTVTINPTVGTPVFTLGASTTRCQGAGTVSADASATNSTGITYSLDLVTSLFPGNSINSSTGLVTFSSLWSGNAVVTASAAGCNGPKTATFTINTTPTVGTPSFSAGSTSSRCVGAGTVTYTATASNNTGITYSLDAASLAAGNTINSSNGAVTYVAGWLGASTITASAAGCNGPKTATHVATTNDLVTTPVFTLGASSTRCQGAGTVSYTASASNASSITYALDATTDAFPGNSINTSTGAVTYASGWSGPSTITVTANGCGGPLTATHTVTTTPTVGTPVFTLGSSSSRCQGAGTVSYAASSSNNTGLSFTLDATSTAAGNSINSANGDVSFVAGWSGSSVITATASGCNGPKTATHTVITNGTVAVPVFSAGASSTRCQGSGTVTYGATATNATSITYSLDATTDAFPGNSINSSTGAVTYASGWSGITYITATAAGCSGPTTAVHTVTITPTVGTPVFTLGSTSIRCQGAGVVNYGATSTNATSITYSLNAASISAGNSINSSTGDVTYVAGWSGTSIITASAAGCNGPKTATHTVTITPTVGNPSFTLGATSIRCQGGNNVTYTASASNNSGLTYSLDAASLAGGNTINAGTGTVTWSPAWNGNSIITVSAAGCSGPKTATHTVTIIPTVGAPVFTLGATSTRCQGGGLVSYAATATNSTSMSYSLDAASTAAGNSINSTTGTVAYAASWSGSSIITASASGCNGPVTSTHVVNITPTVGTPVFSGGSTSTRCQGAGTVTYTATASNATGITYSIDATSATAGNSINASTGVLTYVGGWSGNTIITATAAGCNGPKTATHTVSVTPSVGAPVFAMGPQSARTQGAATITYSASSTNSTGMSYSLDAASLAGGNTINASTGAVTWQANWNGVSMITASATGCNGPATSNHIVTINPAVVQTPLYLSGPGQLLDRIDPVATNITTTLSTGDLSAAATASATFTQTPPLCGDLKIKAQTITVLTYVSITSGTMPANPAITATLQYGATNVITLTNPVYNSGTQMLTWTGTLGADAIIPAGSAIALQITTAQAGVVFKIQYHSVSKPSRISLLPVSTYIDITSFNLYNGAYPGGSIRTSGNPGNVMYARAVATTPFGYKDITNMTVTITPPGTTVTATCVDSTSCTRTYEYAWTVPAGAGSVSLMATAYEGYENNIRNSEVVNFTSCTVCAPVAVNDSAIGAGGAPITVDVLANDYDPNNNIKPSTLSVFVQPNNGTGYYSNGKIVYLPNGSFSGKDTLTYQICDSTALCATGQVFLTVNPLLVDPCSEATKSHLYYIPFPENEARIALDSSTNQTVASNNIRTIISIKIPYPGMVIVWDHWEDGYEANPLNPQQSTTQIWGDGNPYNGIAPGYTNDILPVGGSIVLDNTIPTNPRVQANIFYDGRDKIYSSGQIAVTQVCGEPSVIGLQCMKTNVSSTFEFGTQFTLPVGQDFPSQDFRYTALFIRATEDNTTVNIDKDNNGTFETTAVLNEGQVLHVNGGVLSGATVTSSAPVGVDVHFGGNDNYSSREVPVFPATWYSNTYYTPVPTTGRAQNPADTAVVMLYNSLNRSLTINWSSGVPSSGSITLPPKTPVRFAMPLSATAAYKFTCPTGESFTAIEIVDSYTPGGGGNIGQDFDWSFNLISESRLTDYATIAWAPGSTDGTRNDNPIWVTPTSNTTIYVKYNGDVTQGGSISPCGLHYDVSYTLNALNHKRVLDPNDNDQSGIAIFTCNGAKLAAVYGEDPSTANVANPSWDVGSTIQPFCKQKLIFANDDYARTMVGQPVTIPVLLNDFGFLAVIDPTSVNNAGLPLARHGSITINSNGTIIYTPNPGYVGKDTFDYGVCSTPSPIVCDNAHVYIDIAACPAPFNQNILAGQVFLDKNEDGISNDGGAGVAGAKVYLYVDGNCNATIDANELKDSVIVDASGTYQFITYPEKFVADDFDGPGGTNTCASGSDGNAAWLGNWTDIGDPSVGFCNNSQSAANTDVEIKMDNAFGYALRMKDANRSATRTVNLNGASYAFLTFSYRRKSATMTAGKNLIVQASKDGSTFGTVFTIAGDGNTDANYVTIYNQDITQYAAATTYIRFLTNGSMADADTVYIDNVKVQFLRYPQCYITRLDPASVPAYHHTTTVLQYAVTATSSQTCLAPFNFGIAKNKISVSGSLFNDGNGLTDNLINGTATGVVNGSMVYAYLVDAGGNVAYRAPLTAGGTFNFPAVDIQTNYNLVLSTVSVNVGDIPPGDVSLPANWVTTGDSYGVNNLAGSGIKIGAATASVPVNTGTSNITGLNFGIERLPDSDDKSKNYALNTPGVQYAVPGLTGSDPEDGILGNGNTYRITTVPNNAVLFYNGSLVTQGMVITNFDPALLLIDPSDNTVLSTFTYASVDAAGLLDPTPATVTITWNAVLPLTLIDFSGKLNGAQVDLNWKTAQEMNTDHFEVERSTDGINFTQIGKVAARGSLSSVTNYNMVDPIPVKGMNYYRLKILDKDGTYEYSKIVMIRIDNNIELITQVRPNPFTGKVDVYLSLSHNTQVDFRFVDISGRVVFSKVVKGYKGFNWYTINDLDRLPSAPYMLNIVTDDAVIVQKLIKQ
ncbi:MAG: Ig-like domain-containing protein [Ferruginibacter sp.]